MATFTDKELAKRQMIGVVAAALFAAVAIGCQIGLGRDPNVPEFLEAWRGHAWAGCVVAIAWTGLATLLKEFVNS